jgi:hypothetical protein
MSPKDNRRILWNILIVASIIVIVIAAYLLSQNQDEEIEILNPDEVMNNYNNYIGKDIVVEGYYYTFGQGVITTTVIPVESTDYTGKFLPIDFSDINISLNDRVKYRFSGILNSNDLYPESIVLKVKNIDLV